MISESAHNITRLGPLWVRDDYGSSLKPTRLLSLESSSPDQRLIGALLRKDRQQVLRVLDEHKTWLGKAGAGLFGDSKESYPATWIDRFCLDAIYGNLLCLLDERICELNLSPEFQSLSLSSGACLIEVLREQTATSMIEYERLQASFHDLLNLLSNWLPDVIWLKGTSLSRTLYRQPNHRLSVDFDLVINQDKQNKIVDALIENGFKPIWNNPGFCHQWGVGPTGSLEKLCLKPNSEFEGCHNLTLEKAGYPYLELKFNPLETGLKMKELERFFQDSTLVDLPEARFYAPAIVDHLLLSLAHLHKHGFQGWSWYYDIHLFCSEMSKQESRWGEFTRRCQIEGLETSAYLGLLATQDRLDTAIPPAVLDQLHPLIRESLVAPAIPLVTTEFIWNCNGLPSLLLNSFLLDGGKRKRQALCASFFPADEFLSQYYAHGAAIAWWNRWYYILLNCLVILLPASLVRHTFGPIIWDHQANSKTKT